MESCEDILDTSMLRLSGDFDQQMATIMEYVRLTREQVESLEELFRDLYNALSSEWGDIHVMGFGSVVTGLGIKTSDVDCYIQLPSWMYPPEKSFVLIAKNILMRQPHIFRNPFAIVHAKVPIVQFNHLPTHVNCDINFNSPLGVENSKLIRYLLDCDKRVLHLAVLIKYWTKLHSFTGTNRMPSYCLIILVIFFLQQCDMLPPIKKLQENVEELNIDGWNAAFSTPPHKNIDTHISLYKLTGDFFKYYKAFEFDKNIICPYLGRPVKREAFLIEENVPSDFLAYKTDVGLKKIKPIRLDTVMCVQDPFEHNRNCAVAVHPKLAQIIKNLIESAVLTYENESENDFLRKLLQRTSNRNPATNRKERKLSNVVGVYKHYRKTFNIRHLKQNFRHNNYFRGKNQRNFK